MKLVKQYGHNSKYVVVVVAQQSVEYGKAIVSNVRFRLDNGIVAIHWVSSSKPQTRMITTKMQKYSFFINKCFAFKILQKMIIQVCLWIKTLAM